MQDKLELSAYLNDNKITLIWDSILINNIWVGHNYVIISTVLWDM